MKVSAAVDFCPVQQMYAAACNQCYIAAVLNKERGPVSCDRLYLRGGITGGRPVWYVDVGQVLVFRRSGALDPCKRTE